jgi:hypothetical protein
MYRKGHEFVQDKLVVVWTNTFISMMRNNVDFIFVLKEHIDKPSHAIVQSPIALAITLVLHWKWSICLEHCGITVQFFKYVDFTESQQTLW